MNKQVAVVIGVIVVAGLILIAVSQARNGTVRTASTADSSPSVSSAWQTLTASKSAHVVSRLDLQLPRTSGQSSTQPVVDVSITTEGDGVWREKPSYTGIFRIETAGRGMQLFTDGAIRILPEATIFKLDNLPTLINPTGNLLGKWTKVDAPLLRVTNPEQTFPALETFFSNWNRVEGESYEKVVSEVEAKQLESIFNEKNSGSEAFHVISRLLQRFTVDKAKAKLSKNERELRELSFHFTHPTNTEQEATLTFAFSDYGKDVNIDTPQAESTVKPEVFSQLFGEKPAPISPTPTRGVSQPSSR